MKKIIIDCDPGHDDMMAIILAAASDKIELLGITTIAGNQIGEKTFLNALKIVTLIGRTDIKVSRGYDKPMVRELTVAPEIHGISGLDGAELPEPQSQGTGIHAVDFIISTLENSEEKITLVPTGPLTNIAQVLLKKPSIKDKIERIVLMGGAVYDSNITPAAEFNIYVDPEAASIVFNSGLPITMVGLDVTNRSTINFQEIENLKKSGGKISKIIGSLLEFYAKPNMDIFHLDGAPMHDPLAVAYVIDPSVLTTKFLRVDIETKGEFTAGRTVVDVYGITKKPPNVEVALDVDIKKFKKMIFESIEKFDKN